MRSLFSLAMMLLFACSMQAQDVTTLPPTQHLVLTVRGKGVQIYTCKASQWVFVAPAARLFATNGVEIGSHGDGPVWHLQDGSSVFGKVVAKNASPDPESVPWLLLQALRADGARKLASVEFIRRSDTKGGNPPAGSCDAGVLLRVPYQATYTFFSAK